MYQKGEVDMRHERKLKVLGVKPKVQVQSLKVSFLLEFDNACTKHTTELIDFF
ncbi:hypothetical protein D3C83_280780 [compost metagenome]